MFEIYDYEHRTLYYIEVFLRYFATFALLIFGFSKFFPLQFISNNPLIEIPMKNMEGTDLVWTFFGYSYYYTFFPGFIQILGGVMFLFRSTKLIASLILIPILFNIFLINIFYGPPIAFISGFLLFSCFYIIAMDREIIIDFIRNNKLFSINILSESRAKLIVKTLIRITIVLIPFYLNYSSYLEMRLKKVSDFNGEWIIENYNLKTYFFCPGYSWKRIIWNNGNLTLYTNDRKFSGKYLLEQKDKISIKFFPEQKDILDISGTYKFSVDHEKMFMYLSNEKEYLKINLKKGATLKAY